MSFSEITKKIAKSLGGIFSSQDKKSKSAALRPRRLHMDALEERQLLSVNTVMPNELTVTTPIADKTPTISGNRFYYNNNDSSLNEYTETPWGSNYMSANNQGDVVITWAQNDFVYQMDENGNYVTDALGNKIRVMDRFGNLYDDYNIYARYLTDQVERLTIPEELLSNNVNGAYGKFKLIYAPYEQQRLSIKTVTDSSYSGTGNNVQMRFYLGGADTDGDGSPNFLPVVFDENDSPTENARRIQEALENMGEIYTRATVVAESARDFLITFKYEAGYDIPELEIKDVQVDSGLYAAAITSTVSEPIVLTTTNSYGNDQGILVDPNNPQLTAERIQFAFDSMSDFSVYPRVENFTKEITSESNLKPSYKKFNTPKVSVTVVDGRTFDITFLDGSGISSHEFVLASAVDEFGAEYVGSDAEYSITTLKKSSDIFRVNAPEGNDPLTGMPLVTNQLNPSVAMDADGDFVITWQSEVATSNGTTITDIYARQFSPQAIISEEKITFYDDGYSMPRTLPDGTNNPIQGVRPAGDQFKVNAFSNTYLTDPGIGMDQDGNFVITWSTAYQNYSAGTGVYAKRYDRYGSALSDAFLVSHDNQQQTTLIHSTAAISDDGYLAIAWIHNTDTNTGNIMFVGSLYVSVYAPGSSTPIEGWDKKIIRGDAYNPSLDFSINNKLLVTYTDANPDQAGFKGTYDSEGTDVKARIYSPVIDENGLITDFAEERAEFTVHSLTRHYDGHAYGDDTWRHDQLNGIGKFDANENVVFIYQGYGPDANASLSQSSDYVGEFLIPGSYFLPYLNESKNSDLLMFFDPEHEDFMSITSDVDIAIREYLVAAIRSGATNEQVGRLNAVLESVVGLMRGGANDIFTTRIYSGDWSTTPGATDRVPVVATSSDANITSTRDGANTRFYLMIPTYTTNPMLGNGNLTLMLDHVGDNYGYVSIPLNFSAIPGSNPAVFDPSAFANTIYNTLNSCNNNGSLNANNSTSLLAPGFVGNYLAVPSAEVTYYAPGEFDNLYGGTAWDFNIYGGLYDTYHVYEIVLVGGAHDAQFNVSIDYNASSVTRHDNNANFRGDLGYEVFHAGYSGAEQTTPGLATLPDGSYVASWFTDVTRTDGTVVDRKINYRYFKESNPQVGPRVTDVILPNGQYVANNSMVTYSLENIVVTFDKQLLANGTSGANSVLNPKNWVLMKDGVALNGMIKEISFGMNKSMDMIDPSSALAEGMLAYGSNKWEAIITFTEPLGSGNYELVATNDLTDTSGVTYINGKPVYNKGNALNSNGSTSNGNNRNGSSFSRVFSVNAIDGLLTFGDTKGTVYDDKLVSDMNGEHYTRPGDDRDTPSNPTSVASDEQGNFVTVWTAEGNGIWAKIYNQTFIDGPNGRESVITVRSEFQVTNNPTASYASVAMDADGDFVVTWMQDDSDGRNIYAKAFNANGLPRMDADGNVTTEFRVNSHTDGTHSYPDIAMDPTGGFVITWESLNQSGKNSGYDIYYQRYDSACTPLGGTDEIQSIQFVGNPTSGGTFRIEFEGQLTGSITIGVDMSVTAKNVKAALLAIGLDVDVEAASSDTVFVQFTGKWRTKDVVPMTVRDIKFKDAKSSQAILCSTISNGISGESRANDTTVGDKRYASIAMAQSGEFIISWTSWGQGADSPYETNIYAKNFPANTSVASKNSQVSLANRIEIMNTVDRSMLKIVSSDSPINHLTGSSSYTGVVQIYTIDDAGNRLGWGSGSLLTSGMHILTAAHVVTDQAGNHTPIENLEVVFELPTGRVSYMVTQSIVHYSYTGLYAVETDLAILTLAELAPATAERYDIYRGGEELGSIQTTVGYGSYGTGQTGNLLPDGSDYRSDGNKRYGQNRYEATGDIFDPTYNPNTLVYDFDDGTSRHDALGYYFGIHDLGLGAAKEATSAQGDSGGPAFIGGKIAGVVSYGGPMYANSRTDYNDISDCSFGEFSVDVRVSAYADWIDSIVETGTTEYLVNQTEKGDQMWSDVAISMNGEVIFTWTSFNQDGIGNGPGGTSDGLAGVYARRFTMNGTPVTGALGVDVNDPGNYDPDTGELIVSAGMVMLGDEFLVNDYVADDQYYSSVSMSNSGDFMITWESFRDRHQITTTLPDTGYGIGGTITETVTDFGIYAKRFTNLQTLMASRDHDNTSQYGLPNNTRYITGYGYIGIHGEIGSEFRVNKNHIVGDQTGATVTLNANGDAIVVFQGNTGEEGAETKVYYRAIPLSVDNTAPIVTETTVLVKEPLLDSEGNYQYDAAGNLITKDNKDVISIQDGAVIFGHVNEMVITFSEEMYQASIHDPKSILNVLNWQLQRNGITVNGAIIDIQFGKDKASECGLVAGKTNKWEAVITFNEPLKTGEYTLVIRDPVTDLDDNNLDGDYNGVAGGYFSRTFQVIAPSKVENEDDKDDTDNSEGPGTVDENVYTNTDFGNDSPAIASAADGSFVVVAVHRGEIDTPNEPLLPTYTYDDETGLQNVYPGNIVMQRYDANGKKIGTEQVVNNYMTGSQESPDIAMNSYGNMAIVWTGKGDTSENGVFCRIYDKFGKAVGDQIQINVDFQAICSTPKVAYDDNGNIIVTWIELNSATNSKSIMARVYNSNGVAQNVSVDNGGGTTSQRPLVAEIRNHVRDYDIDMDAQGNLVITWQIHNSSTTSQDIYAKVMTYTSTGNKSGQLNTRVSTFQVNTYTNLTQARPSVATADNGTFVITWASERQDGSNYGVFARRFDMSGKALPILGTTADAQINVTTINMQDYPAVSMAPNGNFVITWTSYDQEPGNYNHDTESTDYGYAHDNGVFARTFSSSGYDLVTDYTPYTSTKEFRLNHTILGDQQYSVVTMNNDGLSFAWVGDVTSEIITDVDETAGTYEYILFETTDVFARTYRVKVDNTSVLGDNSGRSTSRSSYTQKTGGGYTGLGMSTYKYDNTDVLFLDGTKGNDVFEVIISGSGTVQVKINGVLKTVGSNVKDIRFNGLDGNDRITVTTLQDGNTAVLNADEQRLSLTSSIGLVISAYQFEEIELNVAGTNNMINIVAAGNDQMTIKTRDIDLCGDGYHYIATGFDFVSALSGSYTSSVLLYDTPGDDSLTMSYGKAVMKGQGYEHAVSGFGNISAYSSRGNDTAVLEGSAKDDSVFASSNVVSITTGGLVNTARGFEEVYVVGNGGKDSASIAGSVLADRFTGTLDYAEMLFGTGSYVGFYGFSNYNVYGNGGHDVVSLKDVTLKESASGNAKIYDSLLQSYKIFDFNEVRLVQEATGSTDALASTLAVPVTIEVKKVAVIPEETTNDDDLMNLIAAEHANSQKKNGSTNTDEQSELDIDYLLKIGAL